MAASVYVYVTAYRETRERGRPSAEIVPGMNGDFFLITFERGQKITLLPPNRSISAFFREGCLPSPPPSPSPSPPRPPPLQSSPSGGSFSLFISPSDLSDGGSIYADCSYVEGDGRGWNGAGKKDAPSSCKIRSQKINKSSDIPRRRRRRRHRRGVSVWRFFHAKERGNGLGVGLLGVVVHPQCTRSKMLTEDEVSKRGEGAAAARRGKARLTPFYGLARSLVPAWSDWWKRVRVHFSRGAESRERQRRPRPPPPPPAAPAPIPPPPVDSSYQI